MKYKALIVKLFKEMVRDPIVYIFCGLMPIAMLALFAVINHYVDAPVAIFEMKSLVPGIIVFSFSFIMLSLSLTISRDMKTAVLRRIYIAPIKTRNIIVSYIVIGISISLVQEIIAIFSGYILTLILGSAYFSFVDALLLIIVNIPIALIFILSGVIFGMVLSDTAAPGVSSVIISASGIVGGAWMPLETMGGFMKFSSFLPFYPAVYFGRIITGATDAFNNSYMISSSNWYYILVLAFYLVFTFLLCCIIIPKKR